jgi:flagellar motility protein MotE (MotC chaperone)
MRLRLLPLGIMTMATLAVVKTITLAEHVVAPAAPGAPPPSSGLVGAARAQNQTITPAPTPTEEALRATRAVAATRSEPPVRTEDPVSVAERALLEQLRARSQSLEAREQALVEREQMLAAMEARLARRAEELEALRRELAALDARRAEQEQAGWRGLVRVYEQMRPRDAAMIFNELPMEVLLEIVDRMPERRAAPILAAMEPEKARHLTTELARHRTARTGNARM